MRLLIFIAVLLGLFAIQLLGPVQIHLIQPFTGLIAQISAFVLQTFDSDVQAQGIVLRDGATGAAVSIQPGCNGVEALICVVAAMVATPASWRYRIIGLGLDFVAIQALNLLRIISLFYLLQWNPVWFEWAHLYLWQVLIMFDGLVVYLFWLRLLPPEPAGPALPASAPVAP